jgi:hypothetical protein
VESENPDQVMAAVKHLGLSGRDNTNYPRRRDQLDEDAQLGRDTLTVSDRGLRHGLSADRFGWKA